MWNCRPSLLAAGFAAALTLAGCGGKNAFNPAAMKGSAEPDKVLYEQAMNDIQHHRYGVARLEMQTLINTYPDSEYLAKAKLAIADSYYKEGGTSGLTQAVAEYQDFITFFPFLDEAAYAQMQIGMAHYRRMEKPDRDNTDALAAEAAFQTFLEKYPNSPLRAQAAQRLRDVQEVLAEGEYRIADFYYIRHVDRAAAGRLLDLVNRYPLYSKADRANWMLASIYDQIERSDIAAQYYARIAKDYPLSPLAAEAKQRLQKLGVPVPSPDPTAMARMEKDQQIPRDHTNVFLRPFGILKTGPDVSAAARVGTPTMVPPDQDVNESLTPGGTLSVGASSRSGGTTAAAAGTGAYIQTVSPAPSGSGAVTGSDSPASTAGSADPPTSSGAVTGSNAPATDAAPPNASAQAQKPSTNNAKKQTSSKKKGLRKILPW
jgi:outer membrane protein assembly factor BamD